jgi:hypothetical protein
MDTASAEWLMFDVPKLFLYGVAGRIKGADRVPFRSSAPGYKRDTGT